MADVVLIRFHEVKSAKHRRTLVRQLRDAARAALPEDQPRYRVGTLNRDRFKVELPAGEASVDAAGAMFFDLDEPDFTTISLIFELAKAGGMVMVDGAPATVLFDGSQSKTLPPEFRRGKSVVCTSAPQLARMFGVSTTQPARAEPKLHKKHQWSHDHNNRYLGRLPGLTEERHGNTLFIESLHGEGLHLLDDFHRFVRAWKKQGKTVPDGGGLSSMFVHKELRLPNCQIFIPIDVGGFSLRPNSDHLIQPNIEAWLAIARAFGRATKRQTGMIVKGKTFVLNGGRRYPLTRLESRTAPYE